MKKRLLFLLMMYVAFTNHVSAQCESDADFYYSANPSQPCCITFYPCSSAGFGTWNFGDGSSQGGVQGTSHCYANGGSYLVVHTFGGRTVQKYISVSPCVQECELEARYCLTNWDCYQTGPWSYYCYNTYTDVSLGGPHTSTWKVCYNTNNGIICETLTGSSITILDYFFVFYTPGYGYTYWYRKLHSLCLTVQNGNCEDITCESYCPLPIVGPGDSTELREQIATRTIEEINVFPNPVHAGENVSIQVPAGKETDVYEARLFDASGKLLVSQTLTPGSTSFLSTQGCSKGLHMLMLIGSDGQQVVRKVMIE